MTEELQKKIRNNEKLTDAETELLLLSILEKEAEERKENPPPEPPAPEKSYDQKIIDGDIPCPDDMKIVDGQLEYKTQQELYRDKVITEEDYAEYQRMMRNGYLEQTDKYMLADYPITAEQKVLIIEYRDDLRNLPQQSAFPDVEIPKPPVFK